MNIRATISGSLALLGAFLLPQSTSAQDTGWSWENSTEVGFVTTSGNATQTTLSVKSSLTGESGPNSFKIGIGGLKASSEIVTRTAQGTPGDFTVIKNTTTVESASNYYARGRYDRDLGEAFLFSGAGWERNTFAGFLHRYSVVAGVGRTWVDSDAGRFKTDIGGTFTVQEDVQAPGENDGFGGIRTTIEGARTISESAEFETEFVLDENLNNTSDVRFDWLSSVSVDLTEGLALKTSYQLVFDNEPALISVPLFNGGTQTGTVAVESSEFDSFVTLSLVIKL